MLYFRGNLILGFVMNRKYTTRDKIWIVLDTADKDSGAYYRASKIFDVVISSLITLSIIAIIIRSVPWINEKFYLYFRYFEIFCLLVFFSEYALRLYSCKSSKDSNYSGNYGRFWWFVSLSAIIDFIAFAPSMIFFVVNIPIDLRFLRALRLLRLFRLFKASRHGLALIKKTFYKSKRQLWITFCGAFILLITASCAMYYAENSAQPEKFKTIPDAIWWAAMTLTTVGYGDVYPITWYGKTITAFISFLGIGVFAVPTGIIAANLTDILNDGEEDDKYTCPYCKATRIVQNNKKR